MKNIIILNKKEGETPLRALESLRVRRKIEAGVPMTYAGRLDPIASGLLIILSGNKVKEKEKYLKFDKEYEFEVLFGFATDTYDILGKVTKNYELSITNYELEKQIKKELKNFKGKIVQKYPVYSSKTVGGKPLFTYAREEKEVEIPEHEIFIKKIELLKIRKMSREKLLGNIEKRIRKVHGDFRQEEILKIWQKNLSPKQSFGEGMHIASFKIKCSSGTYVRVLANSLGEKLGIPALAFSIKRTKIGRFVL